MNPAITQKIDNIVNDAKRQLLTTGRFEAVLFHAYTMPNGAIKSMVVVVNDLLRDDNTRRLLISMSHSMAIQTKKEFSYILECAVMISDSYFSTQKYKPGVKVSYGEGGYVKPIDDPKRREGIMCCICTATGHEISYQEYERKPGIVVEEIVFTEKHTIEGAAGYMTQLYPPNL